MATPPAGNERENETGRLEAFSDGVFAVAITLLALNLSVPSPAITEHRNGLINALLKQWPEYLAYALSFLSILIMWVNHHTLFKLIKRTNHSFLLLNGFLLLIITAFPFATSLLAQYIEQPDKKAAQLVYSGLSMLMAITYNRMWAYASHDNRLLDPKADKHIVASITKQYAFGPPLYLIALAADWFSAEVSLGLNIVLAIFFALPSTVTRAVSAL